MRFTYGTALATAGILFVACVGTDPELMSANGAGGKSADTTANAVDGAAEGRAGDGGAGACAPATCSDERQNCGELDDGCGNKVTCGSCSPPFGCEAYTMRCGPIQRVQSSTPSIVVGPTTSVGAQWKKATREGSVLLACVAATHVGPLTVTPPEGWTEVTRGGSGTEVVMYAVEAAPVRSGAESWTLASTVKHAAVTMFEYGGFELAKLDQRASKTGSSADGSTMSTGETPTTTGGLELWFGCLNVNSTLPTIAPSNGFSSVDSIRSTDTGPTGLSLFVQDKIVTATGPAKTSLLVVNINDETFNWGGVVATFK